MSNHAADNPYTINLIGPDGEIKTRKQVQAEHIALALQRYGAISEVARRLQIGRSTFYRKKKSAERGGA
jgi:transcriptional regulator of acetoin/glycerol metabolism